MIANSLFDASSGFLLRLAEPAVRSLAVGCLAAAGLAAFRVKRVPLRLFVWTMVLYVALAMPFLGALLPHLAFTMPGAAPAARLAQSAVQSFERSFQRGAVRTAQHEAVASAAFVNSAATAMRGGVNAAKASVNFSLAKTSKRNMKVAFARNAARERAPESATSQPIPAGTLAATDASAPGSAAAPNASRTISWMMILFAAYAVIAFILLSQLLLGLFFSGRLARRAVTIIDSRAQRILRYRACFGGLEKTPRLAESEALAVPATLGVLRPIVLLPADWREWDDAKLDAVLAHEISHVARRDALTQRLSLIHRVVFWFSPLSWWINHQIAELAEEASDEAALAGGADRTHYAETLLGFFAELEATHGRIYWQGVSMANGLRAARRVDRILSWNGAISMKRWLIAAIVALAVPVIFVAGSARPFIAHAQDETKPKVAVPPAVPAPAPAPATQGVVAPALPSAPSGPGVIAPAPMGQSPATPTPVVAPVPGAPLHPPLVPGPIAPGALSSPAPMARPAIAPMGQSPRAAFPGMAPMVPMAGQTPMAAAAPTPPPKFDFQFQMPPGPRAQQSNTIVNGEFDSYSGPRYVIMTANSDSVTMSGSEEDLDHARKIQKKVGGDVIWFERDEKSYLITDPAFIAKAKALFAPEEALSKQEDDLGRQQDALGKQQDALGAKMDAVKVKVPDIAPELQRVKAELDALRASGGTQSDLGRIQSEIGRLQSDIGRYQSDAGVQQSEIGRQQGELGRQQGELGRKQGESGRQEGEIARKASRQLRDMFDDAIAKGIAKPE